MRPIYFNALATWLAEFQWTYRLDLSSAIGEDYGVFDASVSYAEGLRFRACVREFAFRLSDSIYGSGRHRRLFKHATFFENHTRRGDPTNWHAHALVRVEPEFAERFHRQAQRQWMRLTQRFRLTTQTVKRSSDDGVRETFSYVPVNGTLRIAEIDDLAGACRYVTKYDHASDIAPLLQTA